MSFALGIEVTKRCMFRCSHCFVDAGRPREREAGTAEIKALLAEAARAGVDVVGWSGGEPLVRRDIETLTAEASGRGMRVGLATNGYLATRKRLASLKTAGLRVLQVSLDGPDPARARRFRKGPGQAFERALGAVEQGAALGLASWVCTLLVPGTAGELEEMLALCTRLGATGLRYTTYLPVGRARGRPLAEEAWATPEMERLLAHVRHPAPGRPRVLVDCPTGPLPRMRRYVCTAARKTAYVTADGWLYPCTALLYPEYRAGNVLERPLGLLLNEARIFQIQRHLARMAPSGECARCDLEPACHSGCPGRTVAEYGKLASGRRLRSMPGCLYRLQAGGQGTRHRGQEGDCHVDEKEDGEPEAGS